MRAKKNGKIFGMTVYHGSEFVVEKPQHGLGKRTNDYGLGFYCTEDKALAGEWSAAVRPKRALHAQYASGEDRAR